MRYRPNSPLCLYNGSVINTNERNTTRIVFFFFFLPFSPRNQHVKYKAISTGISFPLYSTPLNLFFPQVWRYCHDIIEGVLLLWCHSWTLFGSRRKVCSVRTWLSSPFFSYQLQEQQSVRMLYIEFYSESKGKETKVSFF